MGRPIGEAIVSLLEVARLTDVPLADLRRRLDEAQTIRVGRFEVERRGTNLAAVKRSREADGTIPAWRATADAERERLRRAARAGDRLARQQLAELGELPPAPKPWCDTDEGESDD